MGEAAEDLPKLYSKSLPNSNSSSLRTENRLIVGINNTVGESSIGILINGTNNTVGEECQNITILQSSGCVVMGGLTNVSIFNSSGIIAYNSNVKVEKNIFTLDPTGNSFVVVTTGYTMTTTDPSTILVSMTTASQTLTIPFAGYTEGIDMTDRRIVIKNIGSITFTIAAAGGSLIDGAANKSAATLDSYTLLSNGSNWYII